MQSIQQICASMRSSLPSDVRGCPKVVMLTARIWDAVNGVPALVWDYTFSVSTNWKERSCKVALGALLGMSFLASRVFRIGLTVLLCSGVLRALQNRALRWASLRGYERLVSVLIFTGADIQARNWSREAPIHLAAFKGHSTIVARLIAAGTSPSLEGGLCLKRGAQKHLPIRYAAQSGDLATIQLLHAHTPVSLDLFPFAIQSGSVDAVRWMIKTLAIDVHEPINGKTPLALACEFGKEEVARMLITEYGVDVNQISAFPRAEWKRETGTPLQIAVACGHMRVIRFLVEEAKACLAISEGYGLLHVACHFGRLEVLRYLRSLDFRFLPDHKGACGNAPLHLVTHSYAVEAEECLRFVLEMWKPNLDLLNEDGDTALHIACKRGELARVILLLESGAGVMVRNPEGQTPLHDAAHITGKAPIAILKKLLEKGGDIDNQDHEGRTPLHLAVMKTYQSPKVVQELITECHANVNAKDMVGRTPYHIACMFKEPQFIEILEKAGADPHIQDIGGKIPLDYKTP